MNLSDKTLCLYANMPLCQLAELSPVTVERELTREDVPNDLRVFPTLSQTQTALYDASAPQSAHSHNAPGTAALPSSLNARAPAFYPSCSHDARLRSTARRYPAVRVITPAVDWVEDLTRGVSPEVSGWPIESILRNLILQYSLVFSQSNLDLGDCSVVEHGNDTGNAPPFRQQLRRQPHNVTDEIDSQVDKMLQAGVYRTQ